MATWFRKLSCSVTRRRRGRIWRPLEEEGAFSPTPLLSFSSEVPVFHGPGLPLLSPAFSQGPLGPSYDNACSAWVRPPASTPRTRRRGRAGVPFRRPGADCASRVLVGAHSHPLLLARKGTLSRSHLETRPYLLITASEWHRSKFRLKHRTLVNARLIVLLLGHALLLQRSVPVRSGTFPFMGMARTATPKRRPVFT